MPAPFKWMADEFIGSGIANPPQLEPEALALRNGRFVLGVSSAASPTDQRISVLSQGLDSDRLVAGVSWIHPAGESRSGASLAQTSDSAVILAYTKEPTAGGGDLEDVHYRKFTGSSLAYAQLLTETTVSALADHQLHSAAAGGRNGQYAIAFADYTGADTLTLNIYDPDNVLRDSTAVNVTPGLYSGSVGTLNYRPLAVAGLASGTYAVAWTTAALRTMVRFVSSSGTPSTGEIAFDAGVNSLWPDIAELADGRVVVTAFGVGTGRFAIFNVDGTVSKPATVFSDAISSGFAMRVPVAALPDGRFVIVWQDNVGDVRGQMFLNDGTEDGAEFAVASVTTGSQGRPSVDVLADGRFVVAWETNESGTDLVKYTIFDPRAGAQIITGSSDDDLLNATSFDDAMYGGLGDDRLFGHGGADYIRGGDGLDTLKGGDGGDLLFGEQLGDTLFGENGDDFLYGGLGNDTLSGGAGNDTLYGEENDDTLNGDTDNDVVIGGDGKDLIYGGDGADSIDAGKGDDTVYAGTGADYAFGGDGADILIGEAGNDQLYGAAGADSIDGGADADTIYGGADADFIQGGTGGDILIGEAGNDEINGGDNDDSIDGGADADTLRGGNGVDFIQGGTGADSLFGDADPDTLNGGADGDTLTGGAGGDTMTGGTGFDVFFFAIGSGVDVITDFEDNVDKINLSTYAGATFANTIIAQSGANTVVSFAGAFADQVILVNFTATNLTAGDFLF